MLKYAALALVAVVGATPAFAQEDSAAFSGFRVEAITGWDHLNIGGSNSDGFAFGIGAGYDADVGGFIIGVDLEAQDSTANKFGVSAKRDLYGGIRLGRVVGPQVLFYLKGGYTNARFDSCNPGSCSSSIDGIRIGAGIEHQINANIYIKAEYRYSDYEFGVNRHQVIGGVGYRF